MTFEHLNDEELEILMQLKSRKELTRICYLLDKWSKEFKIEFEISIDYLMAESGFLKAVYIPIDTDDLKVIAKLTYRYIKTYNKRYTEFVKSLIEVYQYCKINGYPKDCNQTVLKV